MSLYAEKLDGLAQTFDLVARQDLSRLSMALRAGQTSLAVAVGSGGSAITAQYLADCRRSLGYPPTLVMTPMEFVAQAERFAAAQIWLLSGSGENPDILAAARSCADLQVSDVQVLTARAPSQLTMSLPALGHVHLTEVADDKDGFLATHSLAGAIAALCIAADAACPRPMSAELVAHLLTSSRSRLSRSHRQSLSADLAQFSAAQTLFVLHDPNLISAAVAIETSCWEAALCPVQRVDFRNFAHGRHVWLAQRPGNAFLLALTSAESSEIWRELRALLPSSTPAAELNAPFAGRLAAALTIIDALCLVEALGEACGRDPAKPGVGDFGRDVYAAPGLGALAAALAPPVRLKRSAIALFDPPEAADHDLLATWTQLQETWATAPVRGLVLDFDGTIVTVEDRREPIPEDLAAQLTRLLDQGLRLGIATGRGGSAGRAMRQALPHRLHSEVTMGYYNGGYIRPLDVDLSTDRPSRPEAIAAALRWLTEQGGFAIDRIKDGFVQLTLPLEDVADMEALAHDLENAGMEGLRLARSSHTVDVCLRSTCKTSVIEALTLRWGIDPSAIMRVGDSGGPLGNDHVLLGSKMGVTVGEVCGRPLEGWPMFGAALNGPAALRKILSSLRNTGDGCFQIDLEALS
ncbi:MAG: HAD hydrolase family protein [Proteobacteria bacterium]|nr:HAD hydrolase family protein [Pseudomonadota bacterium]